MRKQFISPLSKSATNESDWLNLEELAAVEVTSEAPESPVEHALVPGSSSGWRAATSGEQIIRLHFDQPLTIRRVRLVFEEPTKTRTQQFVLRARIGSGSWTDVVRQQFNFSPGGATREQEDYLVSLGAVSALELTIIPDMNGGASYATLQQFRVG